MSRALLLAGVLLAVAPGTALAQVPMMLPAGWRQVLEGTPDTTVQVWTMTPGWHTTTTNAGLWWDTTWVARGDTYVLEMEGYIFPNARPGGYGLFFGGRDLGTPQARYSTFQVSPDGRYSTESKRGSSTLTHTAWAPHSAVARPQGSEDAKNVLRLEVHRTRVDFFINGTKAVTVERLALETDGYFGLRMGAGINLHVTRVRIVPASP